MRAFEEFVKQRYEEGWKDFFSPITKLFQSKQKEKPADASDVWLQNQDDLDRQRQDMAQVPPPLHPNEAFRLHKFKFFMDRWNRDFPPDDLQKQAQSWDIAKNNPRMLAELIELGETILRYGDDASVRFRIGMLKQRLERLRDEQQTQQPPAGQGLLSREELITRAKQLREEGKTVKEIAQLIGRSASTVRKYLAPQPTEPLGPPTPGIKGVVTSRGTRKSLNQKALDRYRNMRNYE